MSENNSSCECGRAPAFVFPCSGGSDVGELSDRAARTLSKESGWKIYCLAGIGGNVSGIVETAKAADDILAIDGCPLHCAKKTLERAGISNFTHLELTAQGFIKGKTPLSESVIQEVVDIVNRHSKKQEV